MSSKNMLTIVLAFMMSVPGLAADKEGNGGDAVVCRDPSNPKKIVSVELLDFYEARTERGIVPVLGDNSLTYQVKVNLALTRFLRIAPQQAKRYIMEANQFEKNAKFLKNAQLVDIPDSRHLSFQNGCAVEQLIIRREPQFPEDRLYTINEDLWNFMDNSNKAGAVLHEIVYGDTIALGQTTSVKARYFNSYLTSGLMETMTLTELNLLEARVGLPKTSASSNISSRTIRFRLFDYTLNALGSVRFMAVQDGKEFDCKILASAGRACEITLPHAGDFQWAYSITTVEGSRNGFFGVRAENSEGDIIEFHNSGISGTFIRQIMGPRGSETSGLNSAWID